MIFVTGDKTRIVVPWREDLSQLIPHGQPLAFKGENLFVIPNEHDEAKVCRNLGVPVPAPILTRYDWAGQKPWDIQRTTAALLTESPRAYVLSTMGTGKTRSALFAADYLVRHAGIKKVLIAAPLSTLTPVWETEIFRVLPRDKTVVLYGDKLKRQKLLASDATYYIINHHGLALLGPELIKKQFGIFIIDELAVFRNKSTELWKAATTVVNAPGMEYVWGLTGSPTPNAPTDAWAQLKMITPNRVTRTMASFKDQTMRQITSFKWLPRPEANQIVHAAMQPSVRYTRDDVAELPPTSYVDREVKLGPEAAKAYKMLFDKMRTLTSGGQSITAVNEGVLQSKLLQVACGFIYTDKHTVYQLPAQDRLAALLEIVEEAERKVIVFVPFIHALEGVADFLGKHKRAIGVVHGGTARGARDKIFRRFQDEDTLDTIVAHPQCMSHGLTLTSANTIIWYSPTNSLETYEQANARITRPGQTAKTLIAHLAGTPVEKLTYQRLKTKGRMQGMLLDLFHQQELEY